MARKNTAVVISSEKHFLKVYANMLEKRDFSVNAVKSKKMLKSKLPENHTDLFLLDNTANDLPLSEFLNALEEKNSVAFVVIFGKSLASFENLSIPVFYFKGENKREQFENFLFGLQKILLRDHSQKELVSMLLHDVRSPLNSLIGYIELLLNSIFGEMKDGQRNILEKVMDLGDSTFDMLEDLNEVYRDMQYKELPTPHTFDLKRTLDTVLVNIWVKADRKNIKIKKEISPDLKHLFGDDYQIQRVLTNLLTNAIKYSPKNSQVSIVIHRGPDKNAEIIIKDNGGGVKPEQLPHLLTNIIA